MSLMKGKKGLIMGVANERSIAWGIAQKLSEAGAELAFTYLGDALKKRVIPLAEKLNSKITFNCDVENKDDVIKLHKLCMFTKVKNTSLLIASHIKPWAKSNNYERLDEYNGFPLTPTYDKLFDRGFISFNSDGGLLVSSRLKISEQEIFNIKNRSFNLTFLNERQEEYIKYHRENIFKN